MHSMNIFRRCFFSNQNHFFPFFCPRLSIIWSKHYLTHTAAWSGWQSFCHYFGRFFFFYIQSRVQQFIYLIWRHPHNTFFFRNQFLINHVNCNCDCRSASPFSCTCLQHPKFSFFNCKFNVLHISVMLF